MDIYLEIVNKKDLIENNILLHTTEMGKERIKKNLNLEEDVVSFCRNIILNKNSKIYRQGKNWYCELDNIIITINSYSYTIITAHKKGGELFNGF